MSINQGDIKFDDINGVEVEVLDPDAERRDPRNEVGDLVYEGDEQEQVLALVRQTGHDEALGYKMNVRNLVDPPEPVDPALLEGSQQEEA